MEKIDFIIIEIITKEFAELGYHIKHNLFNMKNYGILQRTERILIYGIRQDIEISMNLSNVKDLSPKYNKDILEFSMEDAIPIENSDILKLIPDNKFIESKDNNTEESYGKSHINLNKCYQNVELSFRTRAKSTYSAIIDKDDISRTILCSYGRMPRLFVPIKTV